MLAPASAVASAGAVRGACPGVASPMEAADGLLARVRLPGGAITPAGLRAVAEVAEQHGSGVVELTARANLQLRGLTSGGVEPAATALVAVGLVHPDPERDGRRDVVGPPLTGHDPDELFDLTASVAAVAAWLADAELPGRSRRSGRSGSGDLAGRAGEGGLPPKFSVVLDGGGSPSVRSVPADVSLGAVLAPEGHTVFQVAVGRPLDHPSPVGLVTCRPGHDGTDPVDHLVSVVASAARLSAAHGARLAEVADRIGVDEVLAALVGGVPLRCRPVPAPDVLVPTPIGTLAHPVDGRRSVGAAPFLGRTDPSGLRTLASLAAETGAEVRTTPWRGVVLAGVPAAQADDVVARLAAAGFSADPHDPAHLVSACVGSPGCASSRADTAAAARSLVAAGQAPTTQVHLSGCEKACGAPAAGTVVADELGRFPIGGTRW